jgi:hypothetical protein
MMAMTTISCFASNGGSYVWGVN